MAKKRISEAMKHAGGLLSDITPPKKPEPMVGIDPAEIQDDDDLEKADLERAMGGRIISPKTDKEHLSFTDWASMQDYTTYRTATTKAEYIDKAAADFFGPGDDFDMPKFSNKAVYQHVPKTTVVINESSITGLIKRLFDLHILTAESQCFNFMVEALPRSMRESPTYLQERIRKDYSKYYDSLKYSGILFENEQVNNLFFHFFEQLYEYPGKKSYDMYIEFRESYEELLKLASQKGINIDPSFIELRNSDFKTMRDKSECAQVIYLPMFNYLFVSNDHFELYGRDQIMTGIRNHLLQLPDVKKEVKEVKSDFIVINDKKYPKHILESILESDFDNFISNLELEMFLENSN